MAGYGRAEGYPLARRFVKFAGATPGEMLTRTRDEVRAEAIEAVKDGLGSSNLYFGG